MEERLRVAVTVTLGSVVIESTGAGCCARAADARIVDSTRPLAAGRRIARRIECIGGGREGRARSSGRGQRLPPLRYTRTRC